METPSTPARAAELIFALRGTTPSQRRPLGDAAGRILRQEVVADADFPPFDRVMMDGLAVRHHEVTGGRRGFTVLGSAPAGRGRTESGSPDHDRRGLAGGRRLHPALRVV